MKTFAFVAAAALALSSASAQALTLWSNVPLGSSTGAAGIDTSGFNAAMGFSVPAGPDYSLDTLSLALEDAAGDTPLIRLFSDSGANPSTALMTFNNPVIADNSLDVYEFTPSATTTLLASTDYWIVVQSTAGSYDWSRSNPSVEPTGTFSYLGTRFNGDPPTDPADGLHYGIQIEGTAAMAPVPLPMTAWLMVVGLGALAASARRQA